MLTIIYPFTHVHGQESESFIADREITILSLKGGQADTIPEEVSDYIKEKTGITLKMESISSDDSNTALAQGLTANDLPDIVSFYLDDSGRPEMPMLLKAANEERFTNLTPLLKMDSITTLNKYLDDDYLPVDTRDNIMFRPEWDGASYIMHNRIDRYPAMKKPNPEITKLYIRKDIAEDLDVEMDTIHTSDELYDLGKKIQEKGYTDKNGVPVTIFGPTVWGGDDRDWLYHDLVWTGISREKFMEDEDGNLKHESQTPYIMERVKQVHKYFDEKLMPQDYYTMEAARASELIYQQNFAIITDIHSYRPELEGLDYIPLGNLNRVDGTSDMVIRYKTGYSAWAIPATTEKPEEVMQFADWLASREGKLLYLYGLEGRDYELDGDNNPIVKPEVYDEIMNNSDKAVSRGFRSAGSYWGDEVAYTDFAHEEDFGEGQWGEKIREERGEIVAGDKIRELYHYDEKFENARIVDGQTVQSLLFEYEGEDGGLINALAQYNDDVLKMYHAESIEDAEKILEHSKKNLEDNDLAGFIKYVEQQIKDGKKIYY